MDAPANNPHVPQENRWFYCHAREDKEAGALYDALGVHLGATARRRFRPWRDRHVLVGEYWDAEIQAALRGAHLGVLALSPRFFTRPYIVDQELPALLAEGGPRIVPALLYPVNLALTDTRGLAGRQIWRDADGKAFSERRGARRDAWVAGLAAQMSAVVDHHGVKP